MANNRPLVIALAVVAVVVSIIVIVLLVNSSNSPETIVEDTGSNSSQDENSIRTQVFTEMTSTAALLVSTNQAATLISMQETLNAQGTLIAHPQSSETNDNTMTATSVASDPTSVPSPVSVSATESTCQVVLADNGIPDDHFYQMVVEPNTVHLWISGPACVVYGGLEIQCFPVTNVSGNAIVLLPVNNQRTEYTLTDIIPNLNDHAAYEGCSETEWQTWVTNRAQNLFYPPNCVDGQGCQEIRFVTILGPRVVSNEVRTQ